MVSMTVIVVVISILDLLMPKMAYNMLLVTCDSSIWQIYNGVYNIHTYIQIELSYLLTHLPYIYIHMYIQYTVSQ